MSCKDIASRDIVLSADYKNFLENCSIELSDWDKAAIIYNHKTATYDEKNEMLLNIISNTSDKLLKDQIEMNKTLIKKIVFLCDE